MLLSVLLTEQLVNNWYTCASLKGGNPINKQIIICKSIKGKWVIYFRREITLVGWNVALTIFTNAMCSWYLESSTIYGRIFIKLAIPWVRLVVFAHRGSQLYFQITRYVLKRRREDTFWGAKSESRVSAPFFASSTV
jgi:hypothetical protein